MTEPVHHPHYHHPHFHDADDDGPKSNKFFDPDHQEHPWNWPYWHYFDIGSHLVAAPWIHHALKNALEAEKAGVTSKALPFLKGASALVPIIGVIGEGIHTAYPIYYAMEDYSDHKISTAKFIGLQATYFAYTVSGIGGIKTIAAKELATYTTLDHRWLGKLVDTFPALQHFVKHHPMLEKIVYSKAWLEERYVPHSLYRESFHSGLADLILDGVDGIRNVTQDAVDALQNARQAQSQPSAKTDHHGTPHMHQPNVACDICAGQLGDLHPMPASAKTTGAALQPHKH